MKFDLFLCIQLVDLIFYPFEVEINLVQHMQVVHPFWIMNMNLMQPYPQQEGRLTNIMRPFSSTVC